MAPPGQDDPAQRHSTGIGEALPAACFSLTLETMQPESSLTPGAGGYVNSHDLDSDRSLAPSPSLLHRFFLRISHMCSNDGMEPRWCENLKEAPLKAGRDILLSHILFAGR